MYVRECGGDCREIAGRTSFTHVTDSDSLTRALQNWIQPIQRIVDAYLPDGNMLVKLPAVSFCSYYAVVFAFISL
jgi:hypothetical protein